MRGWCDRAGVTHRSPTGRRCSSLLTRMGGRPTEARPADRHSTSLQRHEGAQGDSTLTQTWQCSSRPPRPASHSSRPAGWPCRRPSWRTAGMQEACKGGSCLRWHTDEHAAAAMAATWSRNSTGAAQVPDSRPHRSIHFGRGQHRFDRHGLAGWRHRSRGVGCVHIDDNVGCCSGRGSGEGGQMVAMAGVGRM